MGNVLGGGMTEMAPEVTVQEPGNPKAVAPKALGVIFQGTRETWLRGVCGEFP